MGTGTLKGIRAIPSSHKGTGNENQIGTLNDTGYPTISFTVPIPGLYTNQKGELEEGKRYSCPWSIDDQGHPTSGIPRVDLGLISDLG